MAVEADEWMSAHEAHELLSQAMGPVMAPKTICTWAFRDLVAAQADRLIFNGETNTDATVPKEFWWACGGEALQQNWFTGDFGMHTYELGRCEAFGVKFRRTHIEARLPA